MRFADVLLPCQWNWNHITTDPQRSWVYWGIKWWHGIVFLNACLSGKTTVLFVLWVQPVFAWKWKCVCSSLCVCLCDTVRGLKPVHSRGFRLDCFWSFPLYVCSTDEVLTLRCVVICVSVGLCEEKSPKTANFSSLFNTAKNPLLLFPSLHPSIQLCGLKTLSVISSCGICCCFTDSFSVPVSCVDLHFLLKSGLWCRPWTQLLSQRLHRVNTSNKVALRLAEHVLIAGRFLGWEHLIWVTSEGYLKNQIKAQEGKLKLNSKSHM